jgi:hypothetical protein
MLLERQVLFSVIMMNQLASFSLVAIAQTVCRALFCTAFAILFGNILHGYITFCRGCLDFYTVGLAAVCYAIQETRNGAFFENKTFSSAGLVILMVCSFMDGFATCMFTRCDEGCGLHCFRSKFRVSRLQERSGLW